MSSGMLCDLSTVWDNDLSQFQPNTPSFWSWFTISEKVILSLCSRTLHCLTEHWFLDMSHFVFKIMRLRGKQWNNISPSSFLLYHLPHPCNYKKEKPEVNCYFLLLLHAYEPLITALSSRCRRFPPFKKKFASCWGSSGTCGTRGGGSLETS